MEQKSTVIRINSELKSRIDSMKANSSYTDFLTRIIDELSDPDRKKVSTKDEKDKIIITLEQIKKMFRAQERDKIDKILNLAINNNKYYKLVNLLQEELEKSFQDYDIKNYIVPKKYFEKLKNELKNI